MISRRTAESSTQEHSNSNTHYLSQSDGIIIFNEKLVPIWMNQPAEAIFREMKRGCQPCNEFWRWYHPDGTCILDGELPWSQALLSQSPVCTMMMRPGSASDNEWQICVHAFPQETKGHTVKEIFCVIKNLTDQKEKIKPFNYDQKKKVAISAIPFIPEDRCRDLYPYLLVKNDSTNKQNELLNILDTIPIQIWMLDESLKYRVINRAHAEFLGISPGAISEQNFRKLVSPSSAEAIVDATEVAALSNETVFFECNLDDRKGVTHRFLVSIKMGAKTHQERPVYIYSAIDITSFTAAETALEERHAQLLESYDELALHQEYIRQSEERYRHLFSHLTSGFAVHEIIQDENGIPCDYRFLEVNPAFEHMTGLKAKELIGRRVREVLPGTEPYWIELYGHVAATGESIHFEEYSRELKKYYSVLAYSPEPGQFATLFLDITERRCMEAALKKSEAEYRSVVEDQTELICRFLPDGTHTFANAAYCRYYGIDRGTINDQQFQPNLHPDDCIRLKDYFRSLTPDKPVDTIEHRVILHDGRIRWQRWTDRAIFDNEGACIEYQSVGKDITEQKLAEEARNSLLEEKDILLREIHHRVKNNLQLISGLLDMTCLRSKDSETIDILTETRMRILLMAHIHECLYQNSNISRINLLDTIKDQAKIISKIYSNYEKDISLKFNDTDCSIPVSSAVPFALIANELLTNCFKHAFTSRKNGLIECEIEADAETLTLIIRDDGVGLPEGCDPLQIDSLGLKLIRTLVIGQMKGELHFTNRNGTEVLITIPLGGEES